MPRGPVSAVVSLPGSKSQTNRALVLAALADAPSVVRRPLRSRDTTLMRDGLGGLGCRIEGSDDVWTVTPGPLTGPAHVDCGLAGTVMRFLPPVAALATGPVTFDGDPHMRQRPVGPVLDALRSLGVDVAGAEPAVHGARVGHGAWRHGRRRRLGVLAVRLGAADRGRQVRARGSTCATTGSRCPHSPTSR